MKNLWIPSLFLIVSTAAARACDTCGCEFCEPGAINGLAFGGSTADKSSYFFSSIAEQYTDYSSIKNIGDAAPGASPDQFERSAITQFIVGYQVNERLGVQINVPYIYRWYRTMNNAGTAMDSGQSDGLGDVSIVANYIVARDVQPNWGYSWRVSGGVKLPTGDSSLLELEDPNTTQLSPLNGDSSAIGGHDVALGSGSVDGIIATGINVNWQRAFFSADVDYAIRSAGRADYRYSNELSWSAGPGYRLFENADYTLSLQLLATGEYKAADTVQGVGTDDTFVSSVGLGPKVLFNWNQHFTANLALEVPVMQHYDTGFQAVETYRIKAGVTFRF